MHIVMAASEMTPFAKTGGLADVVGALPVALAERGHTVTIFLPLYRVTKPYLAQAQALPYIPGVKMGTATEWGKLWELHWKARINVIFVEHDHYFDRAGIYNESQINYPDNLQRFVYFNKMVMEAMHILQLHADVLHTHDWQAGLLPLLVRHEEVTRKITLVKKTVFTIHNLAFQGLFAKELYPLLNLPWNYFRVDGLEFYDQVNLLKAGVNFSDVVTTVSPTYAKEIQEDGFGCMLEDTMVSIKDRLYGILNGIDTDEWNPARDNLIPAHYSSKHLQGKKLCREDLMKRLNLVVGNRAPIIGWVSRMAHQKGVDLFTPIVRDLMNKHDFALAVLGSGDKRYQDFFINLGRDYPGRVSMTTHFDNTLAHQIEAGADMFLMPSLYEPCGLNQMYSLCYGTIPIVRATGGLEDTVLDFNPETKKGNGFKFHSFNPLDLRSKIEEAFQVFSKPDLWQVLIENAMHQDFSWRKSARKYEQIYRGAKIEPAIKAA